MKSSKNNKNDLDEISRETQRIISNSHVRLPYHKSKQKSLKDFLNRHKMSTECQASITGSKKLLQKAWDFIETKEQNAEKFYNEDCCQSESCDNMSSANDVESDKKFSLIDNQDNELNAKDITSENSGDDDDDDDDEDEENFKCKNIISENSDEEENYADVLSENNDNEEDNCSQASLASSLGSNKCFTQRNISENDENSENDSNSSKFELNADCHDIKMSNDKRTIVKDFIDDEAESSELDYSSDDDENNSTNCIDESDDDVDIKEFSKKKRCRKIILSESSDDESVVSNTDIKLTSDDLIKPLFNEPEPNISTQQLMGLCSGEFHTQNSEPPEENNQDSDDDFDSSVPQKDSQVENLNSSDNEDIEDIPKLTSAKDFFDEEAELSESDWSSDDEDHLVDNIDTLEEEIGDRDALDEDIVKDGLDKIYMRQLLDDDKEQVSALKEMLLEDGNLHSDSGRKRKFQWETDENDAIFKKPLFSDNDDNDEEENDDDTSEQWRTERFKREAYLSQKNKIEDEKTSDILQKSISVAKKSTEISLSNKCIKGSFMKHTNTNKMVNTLLYINKKTINTNNDETHDGKHGEKNQIKSNTSSNPFAYLLRNDNKPEIKNDKMMNEKKENTSLHNPCNDSVQSTHLLCESKSYKSINSILKQLE